MTEGGTFPPVGAIGGALAFGGCVFDGDADDFFFSTAFFGGLVRSSSSVDDKLLFDTFSSALFVIGGIVFS